MSGRRVGIGAALAEAITAWADATQTRLELARQQQWIAGYRAGHEDARRIIREAGRDLATRPAPGPSPEETPNA